MKNELELKAHRLDSFATTSWNARTSSGRTPKARLKAVAVEVCGLWPGVLLTRKRSGH
jgi:hypothetical protein